MISRRRLGALAVVATVTALFASVAPATAAAPAWKLETAANSTAVPGSTFIYLAQLTNVGDAATDGSEIELLAVFPTGITGVEAGSTEFFGFECTAGDGVSPVAGASNIRCSPKNGNFLNLHATRQVPITVKVDPATLDGTLTASFEVTGGGGAAISTVDPTRIAESSSGFALDAFDGHVGADPTGTPYLQAGGHPNDLLTTVDFSTRENQDLDEIIPLTGIGFPTEPPKDAVVDTPPGVLGNPTVATACSPADLAEGFSLESRPLCSPDSQVGTILIRTITGNIVLGPEAVFNMDPPPGVPARFGFAVIGSIQTIDAHLRSDGSYGLAVGSHNINEGLAIGGFLVDFWGVPADPSHDSERDCEGERSPADGGESCPSALPEPLPFLRNTTACTAKADEGLPWSAHADSWFNPGATLPEGNPDTSDANWKNKSYLSHKAPGYPANPEDPSTPWGDQVGVTDCAAVPFEPSFEATPTSNQADSPTGLEVDISVPQEECWEEVGATCQSDLKKAVVTLPAGMSVNPSSASGLGACSAAQIGLLGSNFAGINPVHFTGAPAHCPEDSKVGEVSIQTPLLDHEIKGAVYLAKQQDNPFKSLLALYIVAEDPESGVILKLPGEIEAKPDGQLLTSFDHNPQLPFSHLHLELKSGSRAPLINPPACGKYTTQATMTPWAQNGDVAQSSAFEITTGPSGAPCPPKPATFNPKLSAGTQNPLAATYSPFSLRLTREDATQRLAALRAAFPKGLVGKLAGTTYCPDSTLGAISPALGSGAAQITSPSCPASSQVGVVTVGAGAGPTPFYTQVNKAYLAGPYKGAPLSLAVVAPAVAGPFDLGNVVVRNALRVDPETTEITAVSDPLPTSLYGIPLDLRDVRVDVNRNQFTLNPTSCDPMSVNATVTGTEGATANLSNHFQVGECGRLPFKPKLSFHLKGGTKRGDHPAFSATLTAKPGEANIARVAVSLPHSEFLDQSHIGTVCTRVQFAANQCPAKSVYGYAKAITPLLDKPLAGPVYLRSSDNELPDLVAKLSGQIEVVLDGHVDSIHRGIRNTFEVVPDAPVKKFTLTMKGAKKGLLQNSTDICANTFRATVLMDAQNGKTYDSRPTLQSDCGGKSRKKAHHHRGGK